jgi:hypothetical protein
MWKAREREETAMAFQFFLFLVILEAKESALSGNVFAISVGCTRNM